MRRVKDYNTYIKEASGFLETSPAAKKVSDILDRSKERKITAKSKEQIEAGEDSIVSGQKFGEWSDEEKGYVGASSLFSGKIVLRELEEDGITTREYEVLTGLNQGLKGKFEWSGSKENSWPKSDKPYGKKWEDVLGPDEEFLKTFTSPLSRWGTALDGLPGITFESRGDKGEFIIVYDDIYQLYGKVEIIHDATLSDPPCYRYEVIDGPNAGKKGSSFTVVKKGDDPTSIKFKDQGILAPFSNIPSFYPSNTVVFPASKSYDENTKFINKTSRGNTSSTGFNPAQIIYLDTSELTNINPPDKSEFLKSYGELEGENGDVYSPFKESVTGDYGYVEKSKYSSTELSTSGIGPGKNTPSTCSDLPIKGNKLPGIFMDVYLYNDIALYTVNCKNTEGVPTLKWDNEVGAYGNNFFTGKFLVDANTWKYLKGEWYFDHVAKTVGLIYAFDSSGKMVDFIYSPAAKFPDDYGLF